MYLTLKKQADGSYRAPCPICGAEAHVTAALVLVACCSHLRRRWRVTADRRVRAEFREEVGTRKS